MSVAKDDDNNKVFGITFRTPPDNHKGIPHILEVTILMMNILME
jgi:Zn-dependent M16 (insulinase) family peptidase